MSLVVILISTASLLAQNNGNNADLPVGWIDSQKVNKLEQSKCKSGGILREIFGPEINDCISTEPKMSVWECKNKIDVHISDITYRCSPSALSAFWLIRDYKLQILLQPSDMHPEDVAECSGCRYDVDISIDVESEEYSLVQLFWRGDGLGGDKEPRLIDSNGLEGGCSGIKGQCSALPFLAIILLRKKRSHMTRLQTGRKRVNEK